MEWLFTVLLVAGTILYGFQKVDRKMIEKTVGTAPERRCDTG